MRVDIGLKDRVTGTYGTYSLTYPDDYPLDVIEFMFDEGNYACDCNRVLFLYGWDEDQWPNGPFDCSTERIDLEWATIWETGQKLNINGTWIRA